MDITLDNQGHNPSSGGIIPLPESLLSVGGAKGNSGSEVGVSLLPC